MTIHQEQPTARQNAASCSDASQSGGTGAQAAMADWPPDGTAVARAAEMRPAVPYNDRGRRLKNLTEAVALRENDLAQAQRAPSISESKARCRQIAGRLHRARMALAELHAS